MSLAAPLPWIFWGKVYHLNQYWWLFWPFKFIMISNLGSIRGSIGQKWWKQVQKKPIFPLPILRDQKIAISILVQRLIDRSSILDLTTLPLTRIWSERVSGRYALDSPFLFAHTQKRGGGRTEQTRKRWEVLAAFGRANSLMNDWLHWSSDFHRSRRWEIWWIKKNWTVDFGGLGVGEKVGSGMPWCEKTWLGLISRWGIPLL